jgi:type II secretory pathway pseudopilin PulG
MKTNSTIKSAAQRQAGAFTLIEMIGVLAVIAILAALLIPKVTSAISDARVNSTVGSYQTVQTAAASHYSKYNAFNLMFTTNATPAEQANWDTGVLIPEGFLDQPFGAKIGTSATVQVVSGGGNGGTGYKLDGVNVSTKANAYTVECVISNVAAQDAYDVATRLDGGLVGTNVVGNNLTGGRVVWSSTAPNNLYLYVAGR